MRSRVFLVLCLIACLVPQALGATLTVGPGKKFARIEDANKKAKPGDVIAVYPLKDNKPYEGVAIFVRQKRIAFRAVPARGEKYVRISGKGFDYSGRGSTPRAIFQFNRGTDGCLLEGFELYDAHNKSHNGAGVRINQANHVVVRNCNIHNNDMGIMSNGDGTPKAGVNQRIEYTILHHNGSSEDPGYNHNLYLGGTSVTLSHCEVHSSLTGHNVKSRAHYTRVEYSYIHDSANREFDLVDAKDTEYPESHAVLMGNIIVKNPKCRGNRAVIHYGNDGGKDHNGTIYLIHNTIITPFISPVVDLSAPSAKAHLVGNFVTDGGVNQRGQKLVKVRKGVKLGDVTGMANWFGKGFSRPDGIGLDEKTNRFGKSIPSPFKDPKNHNYHPAKRFPTGLGVKDIDVPSVPGAPKGKVKLLEWQYVHPADKEERPKEKKLTVGAYSPL